MTAISLNHVSIHAPNLEESVRFYRDLFGMEPVPTPNFEVPVQWLQCGDQQLHLFERDVEPPRYHHVGILVDDFEEVYRRVQEDDLFANWDDTSEANIYLLPDGAVQLYLNDPAGNLIEINWPDVETLDESVRKDITDRADLVDQTGEAAEASLDLPSIR
ncbi:MAG: VOC family protein [Halobacteriota archaeon]